MNRTYTVHSIHYSNASIPNMELKAEISHSEEFDCLDLILTFNTEGFEVEMELDSIDERKDVWVRLCNAFLDGSKLHDAVFNDSNGLNSIFVGPDWVIFSLADYGGRIDGKYTFRIKREACESAFRTILNALTCK
jgi:hypothetical protein